MRTSAIAVGIVCAASSIASAQVRLKTRAVGAVTAGCDAVASFLVPIDKIKEGRSFEENLRAIEFRGPDDATHIYISVPVDAPTNQPVINSRVAGYATDRRTKLSFDQKYPLPFTLHLEGRTKSPKVDDTLFEYQFYKGDEPKCGRSAVGTIVEVNPQFKLDAGSGKAWGKGNGYRMLITASAEGTSTIAPAVTVVPEWKHPRGSFATPNQMNSEYDAGEVHTPRASRNSEELVITLTAADGEKIEGFSPLNVTAPREVEYQGQAVGGCGGALNRATVQNWTSGFLKPSVRDGTRFNLVRSHYFCYRLIDQFGEPIKDSAWGRSKPQVRENIRSVLTSPIAAVRAWIATLPNRLFQTTDAWKDVTDGKIQDHVNATDFPLPLISRSVAGRVTFIPELDAVDEVLLHLADGSGARQAHIWQLSVNGRAAVDATRNSFVSRVINTRLLGGGTQIEIGSRYSVTLVTNP